MMPGKKKIQKSISSLQISFSVCASLPPYNFWIYPDLKIANVENPHYL